VLVTFAAFAKLKGVSGAAVTQACRERIREAIVERNGKRMLDRDKAMELWDRNTMRNGSQRLSAAARDRDRESLPSGDQLRSHIMGLPEDAIPGLDVSRERREHYNAEIARLDALRQRKELVLAEEVKGEAARLARQVRDLLLIIPSRNAARVAAMGDPEEVRSLLQGEIEGALRGLAGG